MARLNQGLNSGERPRINRIIPGYSPCDGQIQPLEIAKLTGRAGQTSLSTTPDGKAVGYSRLTPNHMPRVPRVPIRFLFLDWCQTLTSLFRLRYGNYDGSLFFF